MSEVDEAEREEEAQLAMWKLKKTISMLENSRCVSRPPPPPAATH